MFIQMLSEIRCTTDSCIISSPDSGGDVNSVISGCNFNEYRSIPDNPELM